LPRGQVRENLFARFDQLRFDLRDLLVHVNVQRMRRLVLLQFVQLRLQFENRFFEIKLVLHTR